MNQQECSDFKIKIRLAYKVKQERQQGERRNKAEDVAFTTLRNGVSGNKHNFYRISFIGLFSVALVFGSLMFLSVSIVRSFMSKRRQRNLQREEKGKVHGLVLVCPFSDAF